MMNRRIRMMIDELFSEMKMTAENLALRDELMANALARYEDAVEAGGTEEAAFMEVAASLGDVHALLEEMNGENGRKPEAPDMPPEETRKKEEMKAEEAAKQPRQEETQADGTQEGEPADAQPKTEGKENGACPADLSGALNKAFAALGDWGQQMIPQAKKLMRQMDDATGGVIKDLSKAAQKGLRDAQKAAGETLEKLSGENGELIFDFGPKKQNDAEQKGKTPQDLRERAKDLQAEAGFKDVTGDVQAAQALREQAEALCTQADALEQAQAMEEAQREAAQEAPQAQRQPGVNEDGEIDEQAFSQTVDDIARDAQEAAGGTEPADETAQEPEYVVRDADSPVCGRRVFPAAGLHAVDIRLDADDVCIEAAQENMIEILWEAKDASGEPELEMSGHVLRIRRRNPDVFKTFFSIFSKEAGRITVRVPVGYAVGYEVSTTSGDVTLRGLDADAVKITTTSGSVRTEPIATARAKEIRVTTVSGHVAVSARAEDIAVTTVSGDQFISCDAKKVDVNVVSGRVHVEGACDEWEIDAVHSDVELLCTVAPTGQVKISSMHGTVRLALPSDIRGFVAQTSAALGCPIVNEFGANRYGTCALPIRMETLQGQLMITRL